MILMGSVLLVIYFLFLQAFTIAPVPVERYFLAVLYLAGAVGPALRQVDLHFQQAKPGWRWNGPMSKASNWNVCPSSQ
jgi:hypothetical protein